MKALENKVALVTGGSRSIGKEVALRLAELGADVCLTYHSQAEAAAQTVAEIETLGRKAAALQVDLQGAANIAAFIERFRSVLSE